MYLDRKIIYMAVTMAFLLCFPTQDSVAETEDERAPGREMAIQATKAKPIVNTVTADHSKFKELQFTPEEQKTMKPEQVTETCLKCHNMAGLQFHKTIHWTWRDLDDSGKPTKLGKGGTSVNNF